MTKMRTTLAIDDDVLNAAKEIAAIERKSVGEVISALARRALAPVDTIGRTNGLRQKGSKEMSTLLTHRRKD